MKTFKNILLSFLCTLFFPYLICSSELTFSNSVFSVLLMAVFFIFFRYVSGQNFSVRMKIFAYGAGFIFSAMTAVGYSFENLGFVNIFSIRLYFVILLYTHVFAMGLCALWNMLENKENILRENRYSGVCAKIDAVVHWIAEHRLVMAAVMLVCWLPCYLSIYPGNFRYDALAQLLQSKDGYSGDFPLLHSFIIIKIIMTLKDLTGSYNIGIAVYTVLQMVLLSLLFSQVIHTLGKQGINRFLLSVLLGYYAVFPAVHLLVTCTVRDVMFSGLILCSVLLFYIMSLDYRKFMSQPKNAFLLGITLTLTILSRNNNIGFIVPVILVFVCAAVAFCCRKAGFKGAAVFAATTLGGYFVITAVLAAACQPLLPPKDTSAMSICAQTLARAYYEDGENWSEEDLNSFFSYFGGEPKYVAENADPAKFALKIPQGETKEFLRYWVKTGLRQPSSYINAFLANTRQMWFPAVVVDGYNEQGGFKDYEKCYMTFNLRSESPEEFDSKLPQVEKFYEKLGLFISFEKVPVISMLFSVGFHFWLLINCCFYAAYRKSRHLLLPLTILMGYSLISAFVPLVLLRYFAALFFAFPLVIAWSVQPCSTEENIN